MSDSLDAWERRLYVSGHAIPYAVLAMPTVVYLVLTQDPVGKRLLLTGVAIATALWMLWWFTLHPGWRARHGLMRVFVLGVLVAYAVLGISDEMFGFFSFAGYIYVTEVLPGREKVVGILVNAVLAATSLFGGLPAPEPGPIALYAALCVLFAAVATTFSLLGYVTSRQSQRRKEMVAELAAIVEENAGLHAQLLVQAREAGVLDERQRMAREIHDTLAQGFAGIVTQLQAVDSPSRHVETAIALARENLAEARRSVHALRPAALEGSDLPGALSDVVDGWAGRTGVSASVSCTGHARALHPEVEVTLLRTAQEALSNVAKHAGAARVGLTLSYMEDVVTLDVRDDGRGFDPAADAAGFGLVGMRQRASRLAGALVVESEAGMGTVVSVSVPAIPAEVVR
ncbi:sensor histidine kinase [Saccharothrix violaceirubra]|uniref:Oxygen sensor histidine kinase NreB n=1 Tax=Saccharothrix violaceirubra TaxID=413306 RepID=A0A7W7T642_9PSEU|nr:sensor histidine kinase [Saccharothrix violaceirubra]MBB4966687.1 signal transduction histidine kinase [Saccharothrix violaceirubra]